MSRRRRGRALSGTTEFKKYDLEAVRRIFKLIVVKLVCVRVGGARRNRKQIMAVLTVLFWPVEIVPTGESRGGRRRAGRVLVRPRMRWLRRSTQSLCRCTSSVLQGRATVAAAVMATRRVVSAQSTARVIA